MEPKYTDFRKLFRHLDIPLTSLFFLPEMKVPHGSLLHGVQVLTIGFFEGKLKVFEVTIYDL